MSDEKLRAIDDIAEAGMAAWNEAMKAPGSKTWFGVLPKVYRAMRARDPVFRAMRDALRCAADGSIGLDIVRNTAATALGKLDQERAHG